MKMGIRLMVGVMGLLTACGNSPGGEAVEPVSAIDLNLSTTAASGTEYRLGPATIDVLRDGHEGWELTTTLATEGGERTLHAALEPGHYSVRLRPGWTLSRVEGQTLTPVLATLTSSADQMVSVAPYEASPVSYAFHLGESGIDVGVTVDEGIPPGYDARLVRTGPGASQYVLEWRGGGSICCFSSLAEAQASYSYANIYLAPN
jgi:hypothetical protein